MNVDVKKLIDQDEEFKKFAEITSLKLLLVMKGTDEILKAVYSFYQMGSTPEEIGKWFKSMTSFNLDEPKEEY